MKLRILPLAVLAVLIQFTSTFAQEISNPLAPTEVGTPIYLGPVVGYNYSIHTADIASFVEDQDRCPTFSNGNANGYYFGLSFEYLLGNAKNSKSSIIARLLYNSFPAYFEQGGDTYPSLVEDPSSPTGYTTVESSTKHELNVKYSTITFEPCYKLNLIGTFGFTVGPTFDFTMNTELEQTYKLIEPDYVQFKEDPNSGYRYSDDKRTIYVQEGEIPDAAGFRLGLKAGVQYEILLGRMYVVPAVYYNYGITKLTSMENWYVHALQMGVDIRFSL
jgi:hypothetical protein